MFQTRLGTRVIGSFLAVVAVTLLITLIALWRLHAANDMAHYLVNERLARQQLVADWLGAVLRSEVQASAIAKSDSLEVEDYFQVQLTESDRLIQALQKQVGLRSNASQEKTLLGMIEQRRLEYAAVRDRVFQFKSTGRTVEVEKLVAAEMEPKFSAYAAVINSLLTHEKQQAQLAAEESDDMARSSTILLLGLGALALSAGGLLAWSLRNSLVKPLREAVNAAAQVASGDLTTKVETWRTDEIGELLVALKKMIASLSATVGSVREGVEFMDESVRHIASDNAALASRTSAQAAALEQVATSIEELTATVKENAQSASHADRLAGSASAIVKQGGKAVAQVVLSMGRISASSQKIGSIINVVEAIAFQTTILALNAAVEAARAAEHGRGFAVVAADVRNLAHRSALAAKEIKELIEQSAGEVQKGGTLVTEAGATMEKLVESVGQVSGIMAEIHAASQE